ncbi:MAG: excisionase family DNA-binding protein [Burkholderiaceae bacterium]
MSTAERINETILDEHEVALAKHAQRCLIAALDHSRTQRIVLLNGDEQGQAPELELPPKVLRLFAEMLGLMAKGKPFTLVPQDHEVTTQEAAAMLNVSRPFVVKELEAGRIPFRKVGRHRRIAIEDLQAYRANTKRESEEALQALADQARELGLGY